MLTTSELLFVEQGLYKAIAKDVDTKDPDNLRGKCDREFTRIFNETGAKTFEARVFGNKVGSVSVVKSGGQQVDQIIVNDSKEALAWAIENGFVQIDMKAVEEHFQLTGELGDGFTIESFTNPEKTSTRLRIDPDKVKPYLGAALTTIFGELTEGSNNG